MLPTDLNPLGVNPYDGVMEFKRAGNCFDDTNINYTQNYLQSFELVDNGFRAWGNFEAANYGNVGNGQVDTRNVTIKLPKGEYTLSFDITLNKVTQSHQYICANFFSYNISNYVGTYYRPHVGGIKIGSEPTRLSTTFTVDEDTTGYIVFRINNYDLTITNIAIKAGTDTVYDSYKPNLYRCYGETTQYQNNGQNLIPLPDDELTFSRGEGQHMTWTIKDNKIKMVGDVTQATTYSSICKLTNGYVPQFSTSSSLNEYFLPAGTYTISIQNWSGFSSSNSYPYLRLVNTTGQTFQVGWNNEKGYTFTSEEPIAFAYLFANKIEIDCEFNIQIEAGSTMTEWKPYTTNPTPTIDNPSPITSNYPKGRYKTNLPGITIKLDDDLRGIDEYKDYVEVNVATKEKSITRNIKKTNSTDKGLVFDYYPGVNTENPAIQQLLVRDTNNKWSSALNTYKSYSNRFHYRAWTHEINLFYISRRTMDTLLQCYIPAEDLDSADIAGVKKFFTDYPTEFIYPLSNPITTLL